MIKAICYVNINKTNALFLNTDFQQKYLKEKKNKSFEKGTPQYFYSKSRLNFHF